MKTSKLLLLLLAGAPLLTTSCSDDDPSAPPASKERLVVVCEGVMGMNNSTVAVISDSVVTDNWFEIVNGTELGDTGNDIVMAGDTMMAIAVNGSNLIQYVGSSGRAIAATEDIPNVRRLAVSSDGKYLFATSYAKDGYVAKIDLATYSIVDTCNVGYEPEGVVYHNGRVFVCNTGGHAYLGEHGYESTISVVDAATMTEVKRIDTGCLNLYGQVSKSGDYLCVGAGGDYYMEPAATVVVNMESGECKKYDFATSLSVAYDGKFYTIGTAYDSNWTPVVGSHVISTSDLTATEGLGEYTAAESALDEMKTPYGAYVSSANGDLYVGDARDYVSNGFVYAFGRDGSAKGKWEVKGVNPGHFVMVGGK